MAQFNTLTLTDAGYQLQVKAQAGTQLEFTRVALGDGVLSTTSLNALSALIREKQTSAISSLTVSDGAAKIKVNFSNKDLTESYYLRELGIFADDPDKGEILYAVANAGDAADYMPAYGGVETIEQVFTIELSTGNAANVTAVFAESVYVLKAGDTMTGPLVLSGDPAADLEAAPKQYVDNITNAAPMKTAVKAATTANITLSGTQTIDGITVNTADSVLVKNQTIESQNGIYVVASGNWTRRTDADSESRILQMIVPVSQGTINAASFWYLTTPNPMTLDTTALAFCQIPVSNGNLMNNLYAANATNATYANIGYGLEVRTTDPSNPATGRIWLRSDLA